MPNLKTDLTAPSCLACAVTLVPTEHGWTDTATGLQEGEDGHLHYVHEQIAADEAALAAARTLEVDEDHNYHVSPEAKDSCETCNPYAVVDDAAPVGNVLGLFATEAEASTFIGTLPGHLDGRYSLDGPER